MRKYFSLKNASVHMTATHEDDAIQALATCDMQFKLVFQCCIDLVPLLFAFVLQSGIAYCYKFYQHYCFS